MSAEAVLQTALLAALRGNTGLGAANGVFAGAPVKASVPYVELGELLAVDWGTKTAAGRELRVLATVRDAGETCARAQRLADAVGVAIEGVARDLPGWRVASVVFLRSRVVREPGGRGAGELGGGGRVSRADAGRVRSRFARRRGEEGVTRRLWGVSRPFLCAAPSRDISSPGRRWGLGWKGEA